MRWGLGRLEEELLEESSLGWRPVPLPEDTYQQQCEMVRRQVRATAYPQHARGLLGLAKGSTLARAQERRGESALHLHTLQPNVNWVG